MALGDKNGYAGGNNKKKYNDPEVYSGYNLSNVEGVDPSALSFSFWRNMLKISISPKLQNPTDGRLWDHENKAEVYLTHTKARMLLQMIDDVLDGKRDSGGVTSGENGLITFSNGREFGIDHNCLVIRKIDQDGKVLSTYMYEFKTNYHFAVINFNPETSDFDREYFDSIEVEQLKDLLTEYYTSITNATAYSTVNSLKYDINRINNRLESICENLGIETKSNGNYSRSSGGNSYFNNSGTSKGSATSRSSTIDDLENSLSEDN